MTTPADPAPGPPAAATLGKDELRALEAILARLSGPGALLPPPLFRFVTEVAATPNVDLLVHDAGKGVLLAWRDDPFGRGWHVPGSIIRHREEIAHRLAACARDELGCAVHATAGPVAVLQIFDDRGHSLSLCFAATLAGTPARVLDDGATPERGDLRWFAAPPPDLYPSHDAYRGLIASLGRGEPIPVLTQHTGRRDADPAGAIDPDPAHGLAEPLP